MERTEDDSLTVYSVLAERRVSGKKYTLVRLVGNLNPPEMAGVMENEAGMEAVSIRPENRISIGESGYTSRL